MASIRDLIASLGEQLTPTERQIARVVLEDPMLLAFGTVSDLATRADTSRPSIVRFANKLGFDGFSHLQGWVRDGVSEQLSRPSERIRRGEATPIRREIARSVEQAFEALEGPRLGSLAGPIASARYVWIISGESSMAGAHVLHSGLGMIRPDVHLVGEQSAIRVLSGAGPQDVAIVLDFARYRTRAITVARTLAELGVQIVAITDGPLSPLAALTPTWCELRIPAVGPFDSSVPVVVAAELLVNEVTKRLGDRARDRIDRLEALWQATGTFLDQGGASP